MVWEDTIAAIATPPGQGGIGIVRISGNRSLEIARQLFVFAGSKDQPFRDRYLHYGKLQDSGGRVIDEVLLAYMKSPKSYTMEDVVEIHCHGGMISIGTILKEVIKKGARLAEPGEFTKRAFLNGRIDLVQAEAVMDLISAKTDRLAKISVSQMEGGLSGKISSIRDGLLNLMAHIEATIDYPEEEIEELLPYTISEQIEHRVKEIRDLLKRAEEGKIIRQGIKAVIIGRTNVGKSSLLNALVREERAIVTDIPGTTRDVIEESINIKGIAVRIMDTAGIRETLDQVERVGIERSKRNIEEADLIITLVDSSSPFGDEDRAILKYSGDRRSLVLLNKIDKPSLVTMEDLIGELGEDTPIVETSLTMGKGVDKVEDMIYKMFFKGEIGGDHGSIVTNIRHQNALDQAKDCLVEALDGLDLAVPLDMISIDLRGAIDALGDITGENVNEDLVSRIFSEFCLGK